MEAFSQYLPIAAGVLVSPMPIIAMLVLCIMGHAKTKGLALLSGWFLSSFVLLILGVSMQKEAGFAGPSSGATTFRIIFQFAFALLLLFLALNSWRGRPKKGEEVKEPAWVSALSRQSVPAIFGIGVAMMILNAKNLPLLASGALVIGEEKTSIGEMVGHAALFASIASIGVLTPWILNLIGGDGLKVSMENMRDWLYENNSVIMAVLLFYLGISALGKAMSMVA